MSNAEVFDAVIMGSGKAGSTLALALSKSGRRTALVEREHVGGSCINVACIPSKSLLASARAAHLARNAASYGVETADVRVNMAEVRRRKQQIIEDLRCHTLHRLAEEPNLELLLGEARFTAAKTVEVALKSGGRRTLTAGEIFINTGALPLAPPVPGMAEAPQLDSTAIMELDELPEHLLIIGGSYVGLEFAQMFRRYGSRVTVVERTSQVFPREDEDVTSAIAELIRGEGIELHLQAEVTAAETTAGGRPCLHVRTSGGEQVLTGSHLLVAVGRAPNTESLNLSAAGVVADARGFIPVDERLQTNVPGIYALGDVNGGLQFTHVSLDDYRVVRDNLLGGRHISSEGRLVPYTVFIDPELARVGMSEREARGQGRNIRVARLPMRRVPRACTEGQTIGFMKAVIDASSEQILGAAILGAHAGELIAVVQMAMLGRMPYTVLRDGIFAHPTLVEGLSQMFQEFDSG